MIVIQRSDGGEWYIKLIHEMLYEIATGEQCRRMIHKSDT